MIGTGTPLGPPGRSDVSLPYMVAQGLEAPFSCAALPLHSPARLLFMLGEMPDNKPTTPKRSAKSRAGHRESWYPYYAGFSGSFVQDFLDLIDPPEQSTILDPWAGSGTTLVEALRRGHASIGVDLNPAMVIVSKARLLHQNVAESLCPLAQELLEAMEPVEPTTREPLTAWFVPSAAARWRSLEQGMARVLMHSSKSDLSDPESVSSLSSLAAFFYVALFRAIRGQLARFGSSNPTWVKKPRHPSNRLRSSQGAMERAFLREVGILVANFDQYESREERGTGARVLQGDARRLGLADSSIDVVLTSPPYCTRIDYAVTTAPELAAMGIGPHSGFRDLRESLTGSTAIRALQPPPDGDWGDTCQELLDAVEGHPSKASATYYLKQFKQYFHDLHLSIGELRRVLKQGGEAVLVVQDSLYKDLHVDLATITIEMANQRGLHWKSEYTYETSSSMRTLNPRARVTRGAWAPTETALRFVAS